LPESLSFDAALQRSKQTGKLIFLQFESDECAQCNEVADKAFENKKLSEQLEQTFICIKITADNPDRTRVAALYNKKEGGFGFMFISSDGTLIHNYPGSTTFIKTYEEHIDKALTKAGEGMRISELEKEYRLGNKSPGLVELLMETNKMLGLETDSLLEDYVLLLPADSFKSERTLIFIVQMAPVWDSKASILLRKDYTLFNKAWQSISLPVRIGVNNSIGYKSLQKAIREKNEAYAYRVASFIKSTYTGNSQAGQKSYDLKMIDYYRAVSLDSIKKKDSLNMKALFMKQNAESTTSGNLTTTRRVIKYSPITQMFTRDLNNAAYSFYEMTNDPMLLAKALQWSLKANEFSENYNAMDTHAHLLYKTGKVEEAIVWENKAISLKKKQGFDAKSFEKELLDMKNGHQ
jgi:tetratricopeptide (TPR) repeat protein